MDGDLKPDIHVATNDDGDRPVDGGCLGSIFVIDPVFVMACPWKAECGPLDKEPWPT